MARYNLPPLLRGGSFPAAPDHGRWQPADGTLGQLAKSLKVDADAFKDPDEPIRAIPDPWAQARTFAEALLDPAHSMHTIARGQWRGLLATCALARLRSDDYALSTRRVVLGDTHLFGRVMRYLAPRVALGDRTALWEDPWLVMIEYGRARPVPVAMTNPLCLISPGRDARMLAGVGIPWLTKGPVDPLTLTGATALSIPEIVVIDAWLRNLVAELQSIGGDAASRIRALIVAYAEEIRARIGDVPIAVETLPSVQIDLPDLFRPLFAGVSPQPIGNPASLSRTRVRLDPSRKFGEMKGVILVDPDLGRRPGFDPHRTLVWGTRTLAELTGSESLFAAVSQEAARHGWWLARPSDFFTDRLVRLDNQPLIAGHPASMQDLLLPVRPLALLLDQPLRESISGQASSGHAVITLALRLEDGKEAGLAHTLTRTFSTDGTDGRPVFVPRADWSTYNASVWPDFRSPAWSTYLARFTYGASRRDKMARPTLALSAATIATEIAEAGEAQSAIARAIELNSGRRPIERPDHFLRSERDAGGQYEDLQYSATPIDAILYVEAFGDRGEAGAGMVLLARNDLRISGGNTVVGVDFGTTNTVACFENQKPIAFKPRLVQPVQFRDANKTRDSNHNARWLFSKFLPPELRLCPTPTVALTRTAYPNDEGLWAFRNLIYFHSTLRHAVNAEAKELKEFSRIAIDAKFNLKWSEESANAQAAMDFLEQFMLMVAAEAAAEGRDPRQLLWRFSIPDSLADRRREEFAKHLRTVTSRISTRVDKGGGAKALAGFYSEGLAAARYILDDAGFATEEINIVLDIGGGTTDVTIWEQRKAIWNGSFRIAGQNFFTRAISQNPEILRPIGLEHWIALFDPVQAEGASVAEKDIPHLAEMLFSGATLQEAIDKHWDTKLNIGPGKHLRLTALIFLGGIAWYVGLVVRKLIADGTITAEQVSHTAFALCGRGAGIFKKIHEGLEAEDASDVTRVLQVFDRAAGLETRPRPQLFTTHDAKLEVVRGMVAADESIDASVADGKADVRSEMPIGLGIAFRSGDDLPATATLSEIAVPDRVRAIDLAEIAALVEELRNCAGVAVNLFPDREQGAWKKIQDRVGREIDRSARQSDANRIEEAPFITALRALVDTLALPAEARAKVLTMDFTE